MRSNKVCRRCGVEKSINEFYRVSAQSEARRPMCIACYNQDITARRLANYDKALAREHLKNRKDSTKSVVKRYQQSNKGRAVMVRAAVKWQLQNQDKVRAHRAVRRAIKKGVLTRPSVCCRCQKPSSVQGHHSDYSRQLDVIWLCPACHVGEHRDA